jgi:hypothetical protein
MNMKITKMADADRQKSREQDPRRLQAPWHRIGAQCALHGFHIIVPGSVGNQVSQKSADPGRPPDTHP